MRRPLIFIHIPRTAGLCARWATQDAQYVYWLKGYIHDYRVHELRQLINAHGIRLIGGHTQFYDGLPCSWATILRDPIERFISHFALHRKKLDRHEYQCTLEEYVNTYHGRCDNPNIFDNMMTWQLSSGKTDLEKAKHNLTKFAGIGMFPHVKRFWMRAWDEAQVTPRGSLIKRNATPPTEDATEAAIETIRRNNQLDCELFEFAKGLPNLW